MLKQHPQFFDAQAWARVSLREAPQLQPATLEVVSAVPHSSGISLKESPATEDCSKVGPGGGAHGEFASTRKR